MFFADPSAGNNCCSSTESTPGARPIGETPDLGNHNDQLRGKALTPPYLYSQCDCFNLFLVSHDAYLPYAVLPDFAQVYSFIGSVFDPNATGHLQKLKKMDQIDVETVRFL